jgi:excisionase family DNA binding protein
MDDWYSVGDNWSDNPPKPQQDTEIDSKKLIEMLFGRSKSYTPEQVEAVKRLAKGWALNKNYYKKTVDSFVQHVIGVTPKSLDKKKPTRKEILENTKIVISPAEALKEREALHGIEVVMEYLKVSKKTVYNWTYHGSTTRIPHLKVGKKLLFRLSQIDKWLKKYHTENEKL